MEWDIQQKSETGIKLLNPASPAKSDDNISDIHGQSCPDERKRDGMGCRKGFVEKVYADKKIDCRSDVLEET